MEVSLAFLGSSWGALGGLLGSCPCLARLGRPLGPNLGDLASHFGDHFWAHFGLILGPVFSFVLGVLFARLLGRCSGPEAAQASARRRPEASRRGDFAAIYDGFGMSPLLLLSGLLGPSCSPLGANLAPQGRLLDPKRVPKWSQKWSKTVSKKGTRKRDPTHTQP